MANREGGLGRAVREGFLLLFVSASLAFGVNALRKEPVPLRADPRLFALEVDLPLMSASAAAAAFDAGSHLFLDARDADAYRTGHVGGAFSVPPDEFLDRYDTIGPLLTGGVAVVVYGAAADASTVETLAKELLGAGVTRVSLMLDGYEGWAATGAPTEAGDDPTFAPSDESAPADSAAAPTGEGAP